MALKLLSTLISGRPESLLGEAKLLKALDHPNIVNIIDYGALDHRIGDQPIAAFIAMEWLEGEDLRQRLLHSPLAVLPSLHLMVGVADGTAPAMFLKWTLLSAVNYA